MVAHRAETPEPSPPDTLTQAWSAGSFGLSQVKRPQTRAGAGPLLPRMAARGSPAEGARGLLRGQGPGERGGRWPGGQAPVLRDPRPPWGPASSSGARRPPRVKLPKSGLGWPSGSWLSRARPPRSLAELLPMTPLGPLVIWPGRATATEQAGHPFSPRLPGVSSGLLPQGERGAPGPYPATLGPPPAPPATACSAQALAKVQHQNPR